jgi:4a-hydroxytetrahydrobiopterin dehydratase
MAALSESAIREKLQQLPGWSLSGKSIERQFTFDDFLAGIEFVNRVAEVAESAGHHPDITINYNRVTLSLSTHSEGGITQKDFDLARDIHGLERTSKQKT